jgi:hypothetical protein
MANEYNTDGNPLEQGMQVGQGEAFVFTPNTKPIDILTGALNNQLAFEEKKLKQKEEQAKLKDAALEKELAELKVDPKWDRAIEELDLKLGGLRDELIEARIKGYDVSNPLFSRNIDKKKLELKAKADMNLATFDIYTKLLPELRDVDKYDQNVVNQWIKDLDKITDIEKRYDFITHNRPGDEFDYLKYLRENFSKEVQKGRTTQTEEKKQIAAVKSSYLNLPEYRQMEMYNEGLKNGWYKNNADGSKNLEAMYAAYDKEMLKPYYTKEVSPAPSGGGGYRSYSNNTNKLTVVGERQNYVGTPGTVIDFLTYRQGSKPLYPENYLDTRDNQYKLFRPIGFGYTGWEYTAPDGSYSPGGWEMVGKLVGEERKKVVSSEDEALAFENSDDYDDVEITDMGGGKYTVTYKELKDYKMRVDPYNYQLLQTQGIDLNADADRINRKKGGEAHDYYTLPPSSNMDLRAD